LKSLFQSLPQFKKFFITHAPTPHLNGKHTVFGVVNSADDQKVVDSIVKGDVIEKNTIEGDATDLLASQAELVAKWNEVLDSRAA
jgi:peptidyl-prolyl cis-trans isomerase B (cyclophilin B)